MKLLVGDTEYDVTEALNYATLGALDDLQEQSSTAKFDGVTDPYIRAAFARVSALPPGTDPRGEQDYRRALMGLVFLAKHRADEEVSWESVRKVRLEDAKLVVTAKELEAEAPKESGAAGSPEPE